MQIVHQFLKRRWDGEKALLLGYSGGPDSKALLYSLLETQIPFHIAHVDHGWREESQAEAEELKKEAARIGVPFHTTRLESPSKENREAAARAGRLRFFASLFQTGRYQALLLAHHADDLAETALKRVFEGAHLPYLGGMEEEAALEGIAVWRPLLQVRRKEILAFVEKKGLKPLLDPTNEDPAYLRARLRKDLFPTLAKVFGKEVVENLAHLSERAGELKRYLDQRVEGRRVERGEWGFALDCRGLQRVEARHLIQKRAGLALPRDILETALDWLLEGACSRKVFFQKHWITEAKGWVFFLKSDGRNALPEKGEARKLAFSFDATFKAPKE